MVWGQLVHVLLGVQWPRPKSKVCTGHGGVSAEDGASDAVAALVFSASTELWM